MGKNRKLKNVLNHHIECADSENGNIFDAPTDFLTANDFRVVQKKNGRKSPPYVGESSSDLQNNSSDVHDTADWKDETNHDKNYRKQTPNEDEIAVDLLVDNNEAKDPNMDWEIVCGGETFCNGKDEMAEVKNVVFVESNPIKTVVNISCDITKNAQNLSSDNSAAECLSSISPKIDFESLQGEKTRWEYAFGEVMSEEEEISCLTEDQSNTTHDKTSKIRRKKKKKDYKKKQIDEELENLLKEIESIGKNNQNKKSCAKSGMQEATANDQKGQHKMPEDAGKSQDVRGSDMNCLFNDTIRSESVSEDCNTVKGTLGKKNKKKSRQKLKKMEHSESSEKEVGICESNCGAACSENQELVCSEVEGCREKEVKKKPSKKHLALIHEALKKAKEEEENLKMKEEAKRKAAEEAERIRLEKLKLEEEKKEKKKLKEKQKREKLKAEGRLLSKSQKLARARMEATLTALREQGVDVPMIGEKRPRLGSYKSLPRRRTVSEQSNEANSNGHTIQRHNSETFSSQASSGKGSLSDLPSSYDSKDSWDLSSMEEALLTADSGHLSSEESDILDEKTNSSDSLVAREVPNLKSNLCNNNSNPAKTKLNSSEKCNEAECGIENTPKEVKLRSPIVCVLGHVDTGKTKILDQIRKTHVQDSEAGGITQQIGATMIPRDALKEKCKMVKDFSNLKTKVPGLLVIDTPGHESFSNLRYRGSSVCDIAILVVDIMHGLEPQTIESINILKRGKTPFIVALNKIDRIYGWKSNKEDDIENVVKSQNVATLTEFKKRCQDVILQFAKECLNASLFYENRDPRTFISMVPTSAITGDGMGNLLSLLVQLTQSMMHKKLIFSEELQATVLEVKAISGLGTTIDVILVNGRLREGDTIILAGHEGPFATQIRSLLMPQPLKELRVKNPYIEYKAIEGAQGVKITGKDLDKAIAGLPLYVAANPGKVDYLKQMLSSAFHEAMNLIKTSERGVYVQASTLGSLEALLGYLDSSCIPYFSVKIGPVVKKDVMKASVMLEHDVLYAVILAFDVKIERDAHELADNLGVRIFSADIIYNLVDMYVQFRENLQLKKEVEAKKLAIFPCKLKILPQFILNAKNPIVLGVLVEAGSLREGTPLCVASRDHLDIGTVVKIESNNKRIDCARKGEDVIITIEPKSSDSAKSYGKHFDHEDLLVSRISRQSIDVCKEFYRNELHSSDWNLMVELKKLLHIV